jgi:hypothetical protein
MTPVATDVTAKAAPHVPQRSAFAAVIAPHWGQSKGT